MRYVGQGHDLRIRIAEDEDANTVRRRFGEEHRLQYGHAFDQAPVEIMNLRVVVRERRDRGARPALRQDTVPGGQGGTARPCYFGPPFGLVEAQVLVSRQALRDQPQPGPLVIEEYDTTIVVPPDFTASLDAANNVHLAAAEQDR
jgi:N-methylhydantoinase A